MDTSLSWTARIYKFLFRYRNTPHSTTGETPSQLLMNRVIRTHISLLQGDLKCRVQRRQEAQCASHNKHALTRSFSPGETVFTHFGGHKLIWVPGTIHSVTGPLSYCVKLEDGRIVKRHVDHIRKRHTEADGSRMVGQEMLPYPLPQLVNPSGVEVAEQQTSEDQREREGSLESPKDDHSRPAIAEEDYPIPSLQPPSTPDLRRSTRVRRSPQRLDL